MQVAVIFDGAVITVEHLIMVGFGILGGSIIGVRLKAIRAKLSDIEHKLDQQITKGDRS